MWQEMVSAAHVTLPWCDVTVENQVPIFTYINSQHFLVLRNHKAVHPDDFPVVEKHLKIYLHLLEFWQSANLTNQIWACTIAVVWITMNRVPWVEHIAVWPSGVVFPWHRPAVQRCQCYADMACAVLFFNFRMQKGQRWLLLDHRQNRWHAECLRWGFVRVCDLIRLLFSMIESMWVWDMRAFH